MWAVKSSLCCFVAVCHICWQPKREDSQTKTSGNVSGGACPCTHLAEGIDGAPISSSEWPGRCSGSPLLPLALAMYGYLGGFNLQGCMFQSSKFSPVGRSSCNRAILIEKVTMLISSLPWVISSVIMKEASLLLKCYRFSTPEGSQTSSAHSSTLPMHLLSPALHFCHRAPFFSPVGTSQRWQIDCVYLQLTLLGALTTRECGGSY